MIHLYMTNIDGDEYTFPPESTQKGMAPHVALQRKHIPRVIQKILEKGHVEEIMAHVQDRRQKQKAYTLTQRGLFRAKSLLESVNKTDIQVKRPGGRLETMTVRQLLESDPKIGVLQIHKGMDERGVFDPDILREHEENGTADGSPVTMDRLKIYESVMNKVWSDGRITPDEQNILQEMRSILNISDEENRAIERKYLERSLELISRTRMDIYREILSISLKDGKISDDEKAILEGMAKALNLSDDEKKKVDESFKAKVSKKK